MSIHDFQNRVQKNENSDLLKALRQVTFLDPEDLDGVDLEPWA